MRREAGSGRALGLIALLAATLGPLGLLLLTSLGRDWFYPALWPARLDAESWTATLGVGGRLVRATTTSIALGLGTALLAPAIALPIGRALAELHGWRRHLGAAAAFLPVAVPPVALGTGLQVSVLALGLGGTYPGVLLAHLVPAVGYLALFFLGIFATWDTRIETEARSLGATPRQTLFRVVLPMLRPRLADAAALGFLISWAQVPLTLLIGAGAVSTLPLELYAYVQAGQDRFAATGALLLALPPLAALWAVRVATRGTETVLAV